MDRFLIDECLNADLVAIAKARGYDADYVPHIGKAGWQDWNRFLDQKRFGPIAPIWTPPPTNFLVLHQSIAVI
jgi:hypothetical protein